MWVEQAIPTAQFLSQNVYTIDERNPMMRLLRTLRATCPRCNGTGGHSDFGNWVNCSACRGTGQK